VGQGGTLRGVGNPAARTRQSDSLKQVDAPDPAAFTADGLLSIETLFTMSDDSNFFADHAGLFAGDTFTLENGSSETPLTLNAGTGLPGSPLCSSC